MSGFDVVRILSGPALPVIVIVTAFDQHAIPTFDAGAVDYLLKPVGEARLRTAVERARALVGKPAEIASRIDQVASAQPSGPKTLGKIVGRSGEEYFLLDLDDVLAFQAGRELVWIVTARQRFLATQTLRHRSPPRRLPFQARPPQRSGQCRSRPQNARPQAASAG